MFLVWFQLLYTGARRDSGFGSEQGRRRVAAATGVYLLVFG